MNYICDCNPAYVVVCVGKGIANLHAPTIAVTNMKTELT